MFHIPEKLKNIKKSFGLQVDPTEDSDLETLWSKSFYEYQPESIKHWCYGFFGDDFEIRSVEDTFKENLYYKGKYNENYKHGKGKLYLKFIILSYKLSNKRVNWFLI